MPSQHPRQPPEDPFGDSLALRLALAVDAASIGGFDWNLLTDEIVWDDRMKALLGVAANDQPTLERFSRRIIPADRPALEEVRSPGHRVRRRSTRRLPGDRRVRGHPVAHRQRPGPAR